MVTNKKLVKKVYLVYEGWLYSKLYTNDIRSSLNIVNSFKRDQIGILIQLPNIFNSTKITKAMINYVSYSEQNINLKEIIKRTKSNPTRMKIIRKTIENCFIEIELALCVRLGYYAKIIASRLIKAFADKKNIQEVLNVFKTTCFIASSLRTGKQLICYSKCKTQ